MSTVKISNAGTLEELAKQFNDKLERIELAMAIKNSDDDGDELAGLLDKLEINVKEARLLQSDMRDAVKKWRNDVQAAQNLKTLTNQVEQLTYMSTNIPDRLPTRPSNNSPASTANHVSTQPESHRKEQEEIKENRPPPVAASTGSTRREPRIEYLTVSEFDTIPKYMRGRLTYDKLNGLIDSLNLAFSGKHILITSKKSTLSDTSRERLTVYRNQRTADCKGFTFITDDDIKLFTSIKLDNSFRALLPILRHCGRIKEIHGGGINRYAVPL